MDVDGRGMRVVYSYDADPSARYRIIHRVADQYLVTRCYSCRFPKKKEK